MYALPPTLLLAIIEPNPTPGLYERSLTSGVCSLEPQPKRAVLFSLEPVVGVRPYGVDLPDESGEVEGYISGYILRVWGAHQEPSILRRPGQPNM